MKKYILLNSIPAVNPITYLSSFNVNPLETIDSIVASKSDEFLKEFYPLDKFISISKTVKVERLKYDALDFAKSLINEGAVKYLAMLDELFTDVDNEINTLKIEPVEIGLKDADLSAIDNISNDPVLKDRLKYVLKTMKDIDSADTNKVMFKMLSRMNANVFNVEIVSEVLNVTDKISTAFNNLSEIAKDDMESAASMSSSIKEFIEDNKKRIIDKKVYLSMPTDYTNCIPDEVEKKLAIFKTVSTDTVANITSVITLINNYKPINIKNIRDLFNLEVTKSLNNVSKSDLKIINEIIGFVVVVKVLELDIYKTIVENLKKDIDTFIIDLDSVVEVINKTNV